MPYVESPHAVFKPDDFYDYYGVKGLGSFNNSSIGNGTIGGNTLGLGATGAPIYYLASSSNPKVVALQGGLNKVLVSQGYREIPVTGKMDARTCAALGLMYGKFPEATKAQVDNEILTEAARTCVAAKNSAPIINTQISSFAVEMERTKNPTPAVLVPQTEVVPATTAPVITTPAAPVVTAPTTPPIAQPVPVMIQTDEPPTAPTPIEFEEVTIAARPADKTYSSMNWLAVAAIGGVVALVFVNRKKLGLATT